MIRFDVDFLLGLVFVFRFGFKFWFLIFGKLLVFFKFLFFIGKMRIKEFFLWYFWEV